MKGYIYKTTSPSNKINNMTTETLKKLIEIEFERAETISQFKSTVFQLIDIFKQENNSVPTPPALLDTSEMVPFHEVCGCNPKNGGSGICGCIMGSKLVPRNMGSNIKSGNYYFNSSTSTY